VISPGTWLKQKVKGMISKSDIIIAVLTENGIRSEMVAWELETAYGLGKTVVPIIEDGVDVPGPLKEREYIRFSLTDIEVMFSSLSKFMQKRIGVKTQKLAGLIMLVAGIAAAIIGAILFLYESMDDKLVTQTVENPA
jgi:nucleoside 2-deoxyribosyltransferase